MGAPTVKTPALVELFVKAVEDGASMRLASFAAGITHTTGNRWYHNDEDFRSAVDKARARRATRWLSVLENLTFSEDPAVAIRAATWLLEHCETEDYGKSVKTSVQEEIKSFLDGLKGRLGSQAWKEVLLAASESGATGAGAGGSPASH